MLNTLCGKIVFHTPQGKVVDKASRSFRRLSSYKFSPRPYNRTTRAERGYTNDGERRRAYISGRTPRTPDIRTTLFDLREGVPPKAVPISQADKDRNRLITQCGSVEEVLELFADCGRDFNTVNLSTAFYRVAKLSALEAQEYRHLVRGDPYVRKLAIAVDKVVHQMDTQSLANVAWAHSKLGHGTSQLMTSVVQASLGQLHKFRQQELTNMIWATANDVKSRPTDRRCGHAILELAAQDLLVRLQSNSFQPRNIELVVWSYATCNHRDQELLEALSGVVVANVSNMSVRNFAKICWGYATLKQPAPVMFKAIEGELKRVGTSSMSAQDLTQLMWACAQLDVKEPALLDMLSRESTRKIHSFNAQCIANTVWAHARLEHDTCKPLLEAVIPMAIHHRASFNPQALANTTWAYAALQHDAPELFDAFAEMALLRLSEFTEEGLGAMALAYANNSHVAPELFRQIAAVTMPRLPYLSPQALSNTAWALVVADQMPEDFRKRLRGAVAVVGPYNSQELKQLYQVELSAKLECPELGIDIMLKNAPATRYFQGLWDLGNIRNVTMQCWDKGKKQSTISELQHDVSCTLTSMGLEHVLEYNAEEFPIDMAIVTHRIAIEVDGPSHYITSNLVRKPNGSTLLKRRLLQRLGWQWLSVPYFEYKTTWSQRAKQDFLRQKLIGMRTKMKVAAKPVEEVELGRSALSVLSTNKEAATRPDDLPQMQEYSEIQRKMSKSLAAKKAGFNMLKRPGRSKVSQVLKYTTHASIQTGGGEGDEDVVVKSLQGRHAEAGPSVVPFSDEAESGYDDDSTTEEHTEARSKLSKNLAAKKAGLGLLKRSGRSKASLVLGYTVYDSIRKHNEADEDDTAKSP